MHETHRANLTLRYQVSAVASHCCPKSQSPQLLLLLPAIILHPGFKGGGLKTDRKSKQQQTWFLLCAATCIYCRDSKGLPVYNLTSFSRWIPLIMPVVKLTGNWAAGTQESFFADTAVAGLYLSAIWFWTPWRREQLACTRTWGSTSLGYPHRAFVPELHKSRCC